jgi:threonine dehydratase
LLAGIATAFRLATAWDSHLQQVSVQFVGIRLEDLTASYGDAIKVKVVASGNQRLFERFGIPIVNVTNTHLMAGMLGVYLDLGDQVEGSSGVTHQVTMSRSELLPTEEHLVVCILSGGNVGSFPCETSPPA